MKLKTRIISLIICMMLVLCSCSVIENPESLPSEAQSENRHSRSYFSSIKGNGKDEWLIMLYLNGEGIEDFGIASYIISQLIKTEIPGKITIVIQTFGVTKWQADFMSTLSDRILITSKGISSSATTATNGTAADLRSFVETSEAEFDSCNRKGLFIIGENKLSSFDMEDALNGADLDFLAINSSSFISFEDAYILRNTADYLISSGAEYCVNWDYANFIAMLANNTSYLCRDIARLLYDGIVTDSIFAVTNTNPCLYCLDLTRVQFAKDKVKTLFDEAYQTILEGNFSSIAYARANSSCDDLCIYGTDFADALIYESSSECKKRLEDCMVYHSSDDVKLSLFVPINESVCKDLPSTLSKYSAAGIDYVDFITAYLTAVSCMDTESKTHDWFDKDVAAKYTASGSMLSIELPSKSLAINEDHVVFAVNESDVTKVSSVTTMTFADTGEYYILLGDVPSSEYSGGSYIIATTEDEWMHINGNVVCRYGYVGVDGKEHFRIPCKVNETDVFLIVSDNQVLSALHDTGIFCRTEEIVTGDIITFSYPIISYEGEIMGSTTYGYKIAVAKELAITYSPVSTGDIIIECIIKDITGHSYYSDAFNLRAEIMEKEIS
ncbi:MAG: hypothetical protein IJL16_02460 [Clostridia bacterium]|nr:hypothetical protein [Clostridia bacterium]